MNIATVKLPEWYKRLGDQSPVASAKGWLRLKIASGDREILLEAQREHDALLRQIPPGNPSDLAKQRWRGLRDEYARTHDARILDQIDEVGHKGEALAAELRSRKHLIRDSARKVAATKNCGPIYVKIFEAATEVVLERIRNTEKVEREASEILDAPYSPSSLLKSLAGNAYREPASDPNYLSPPANVLGELWPAIVANSGKEKTK
jgi:hypothetical protein